jgi:hypothetical protein
MPGNSQKESALPAAENGLLQWLMLLFVAWGLAEALRYIWLHA